MLTRCSLWMLAPWPIAVTFAAVVETSIRFKKIKVSIRISNEGLFTRNFHAHLRWYR